MDLLPYMRHLSNMGFKLYASTGTADFYTEHGVDVSKFEIWSYFLSLYQNWTQGLTTVSPFVNDNMSFSLGFLESLHFSLGSILLRIEVPTLWNFSKDKRKRICSSFPDAAPKVTTGSESFGILDTKIRKKSRHFKTPDPSRQKP